jgi:hypothetical protein
MVQHEFRTVGVPADSRSVLAAAASSSAAFANLGAMTGLEKIQ